ncbi:TetR/AcrR family transcriptional regulator [Actinobacillus vicugnae]|uniref:TetR/AcrR family transcriptional regulator n=1 Tax=Actinobacillus vicugnae TaxID=2573093 RepID=UPI001242DD3B|nr:TetR/AcrR family transcriptional regulator [Actinobacillus vicugnae]
MKREDPRIVRTRETIYYAFIQTLEEKNYDEITVQDILDKAKINRSTFYKHYLNKDMLAASIIEQVHQDILQPLLDQRFSTPNLEFAEQAAIVMNQYRTLIQLLWKIENRRISLKRNMQEAMEQKYIEVHQHQSKIEHADIAFQSKLFAIISMGLLEQVIMRDTPLDVSITNDNVKEVLTYFKLD